MSSHSQKNNAYFTHDVPSRTGSAPIVLHVVKQPVPVRTSRKRLHEAASAALGRPLADRECVAFIKKSMNGFYMSHGNGMFTDQTLLSEVRGKKYEFDYLVEYAKASVA